MGRRRTAGLALDLEVHEPVAFSPDIPATPPRSALAKLRRLLDLLVRHVRGEGGDVLDLSDLDTAGRDFVDRTLGDGRLKVAYRGGCRARMDETGLSGVWRVRMCGENGGLGRDTLEVADFPALARNRAFEEASPVDADAPADSPDGTAVLREVLERAAHWRPGDPPHIVDLGEAPTGGIVNQLLDTVLGEGPITVLSCGEETCIITATRQPFVWRVRRYSRGDVPLNETLVVAEVPDDATASDADIARSANRLASILRAFD